MKDLLRFCLTGIGNLEGIDVRKEGVSARICVIHPSFGVPNAHSEEIILHCMIDKQEWLLLLNKLEKESQAGHSIILKFKVVYSHFGSCHNGMGDDPKQMVQLYTRLLRIEGWCRDGHWTNTDDSSDAASLLKVA